MVVGLSSAAHAAGLTELGRRPPFAPYLRETLVRLPFAFTLARYRLVADFQQHRLGILWLLLQPVLTTVVYGVVFYFILSSAARPQPFVPYLVVGVFVFQFYAKSTVGGSKAITNNARLVQSLGFPRALLPIAVALEEALRMVPITALMMVALLLFGVPIAWSWLLIVPVLLMTGLFCLGVSLIMARLAVHFRDVQQLVPFANRFLFYASGVFFSLDRALENHPTLLAIAQWVPTYDFIAIARSVLMPTQSVDPIVWIAASVWAVGALVVGFVWFWAAEERYGRGL